ncbi:MAG: extracellular solute-binding protein, partial [Alphaproteobacteria bacterium]
HGIAMHGTTKYGPDFTHFDYVNPDAPKGGTARMAAIGTFDSLNPFILKGTAAAGIGAIHDTLMANSGDEAFSEYGLIAKSIEVPADRSWVIFNLHEEARFSDDSAITADDVIFSFDTLSHKGHPFYRAYYGSVAEAEKLGPHRVRFSFKPGENRELPLILGQLPVLSKAYWTAADFEKTTLEPPVGSGPYTVAELDPGRSITYRRNPEYWARSLPVRRGTNNFDVIRYDYYRDNTVALEAFKAGEYDFRRENSSKNWATAYDFPAVEDGRVKVEEIPNDVPTGMQGFAFNIRRSMFMDRGVRWALAHAFDFEWSNKNLFYGAYERTKSYFSNSELASRGLPLGRELEILNRYRGLVPEEVFTQPYEPPSTKDRRLRDNLREALRLLEQAGWMVRNGQLTNLETGEPMEF